MNKETEYLESLIIDLNNVISDLKITYSQNKSILWLPLQNLI